MYKNGKIGLEFQYQDKIHHMHQLTLNEIADLLKNISIGFEKLVRAGLPLKIVHYIYIYKYEFFIYEIGTECVTINNAFVTDNNNFKQFQILNFR